MKNICSGCGTENLESANFCHHCGKSMQDHALAFQSSAWPELGIIASASAKAIDTVHQPVADLVVDESGPPDAPTHPEPQPPLDSLQVSAALLAVTKGVPERWSFVPIDENPSPAPQLAHQPKPSLDLPEEPPPQAARAKVELRQDAPQTAQTPSEIEAVDSKFGWLETELHVWEDERKTAGDVPFAKSKTAWWLPIGAVLITAAAGAWWVFGRDGSTDAMTNEAGVTSVTAPAPVVDAASAAPTLEITSAPPVASAVAAAPSATSQPAKAANKKSVNKEKPAASVSPAPVETAAPAAPPASVTIAQPPPAAVEVAQPKGPSSPNEACSNLGLFARQACIAQQCEKAAFAQHAQCQRLRTRQQDQEQQRLYGGS